MQNIMRVLCTAYWILLTFLLLSANPVQLIGLPEDLPAWLAQLLTISHLVSFTLLAILCLVTRWPVPRWSVVLFLFAYATLTELAQGLVPSRRPQWEDVFQDIGGILLGAACCWAVAAALQLLARRRQAAIRSLVPTDQWEVLRKVLSRPATGEQSWWT